MQAGVDAFVVWDSKILLILRDNSTSIQNPNLWNLPGGGIEEGETEINALVRELKEEINLTIKNINYIDQTEYVDGNVVSKFWVKIDDFEKQQLKLGEGQKMNFFTLDAILTLDIIPNLRSYIELNKENLLDIVK